MGDSSIYKLKCRLTWLGSDQMRYTHIIFLGNRAALAREEEQVFCLGKVQSLHRVEDTNSLNRCKRSRTRLTTSFAIHPYKPGTCRKFL